MFTGISIICEIATILKILKIILRWDFILQIFCGTDIIEISRIMKGIESFSSFLEKVFTQKEIDYCEAKKNAKFQSYSGKFAAKEAVVKAIGTGFSGGIGLKDIEILNDEFGRPYTILHRNAFNAFNKISGSTISLSISHCKEYAVAFAIVQIIQEGEIL